MTDEIDREARVEEVWRTYMMEGHLPSFASPPWYESKYLRPLVKLLPTDPRCKSCFYPFQGVGGVLSRAVLGIAPSKLNPQLCNVCENYASRYQGGVEIDLSILFADVRGSTTIAEHMSPTDFSQLIDRFYKATTKVLFRKNAMVEKLIGDEVTGFFAPGFVGELHALVAVEAGHEILRATGHEDPQGPWIPVGVGVHTGRTFVGAVSSEGGAADITVLGDTPNTGARIASQAKVGELLISEAARDAAGLETEGMEGRLLTLKGREQQVKVWMKMMESKDSAA